MNEHQIWHCDICVRTTNVKSKSKYNNIKSRKPKNNKLLLSKILNLINQKTIM